MSVMVSGPLSFTFFLTPEVSIVTNVFGDARNAAGVQIVAGSTVLWSASLTQGSPVATVDQTIKFGNTTIEAGARFTLTVPTPFQLGNVTFAGRVASGPNPPIDVNVQVASWPLNSTATAASGSSATRGRQGANPLADVVMGPLSFTFPLTPEVSIVTNVFGDARNAAGVQIMGGSIVLWSASLTQGSPMAAVDQTIKFGTTTIEAGARFALTVPTQFQLGNVRFSGRVASGANPPIDLNVQVASWPLTSAVA
jgi:hypothetical protein